MASPSTSSDVLTIYDLLPEPGICPYVQRAKITLQEKGLAYETVYIDAANKPQDFLDLFRGIVCNPKHRGTVPVLIDGENKVAESHIVSEYLDVKFASGTKLLPADPTKLALVRLFIENITLAVGPFFKSLGAETKAANEEALKDVVEGFKVLDTFLKTYGSTSGSFLLGDSFSYAEAASLPFFYRLNLVLKEARDFDTKAVLQKEGLDHLAKWLEVGFARESVKATLPPDELLLQSTKKFLKVQLKDLQ